MFDCKAETSLSNLDAIFNSSAVKLNTSCTAETLLGSFSIGGP